VMLIEVVTVVVSAPPLAVPPGSCSTHCSVRVGLEHDLTEPIR